MTIGSQDRKLVGHTFNNAQKAERANDAGQGYTLSWPAPSDILPPSKLHLLKGL